eukprot:TRINITY_DN53_c1_g1_i4.p1 TRINITY_DN53_c1_g1~~TRINITY_DN53_c1_g1_i4.p1  ORF type:complete len:866 (+),score=128.78 TRINITY_DN53_c1_g1_i4:62-2659(+)
MFSRLAAVTLLAASAAASNGHYDTATAEPTSEPTPQPTPIPTVLGSCGPASCTAQGYAFINGLERTCFFHGGCNLETCCVVTCDHPEAVTCPQVGDVQRSARQYIRCEDDAASCTSERCCAPTSCDYFVCPGGYSPLPEPVCEDTGCVLSSCCEEDMYCSHDICDREGYIAIIPLFDARIRCPSSGCDLGTCCTAQCGHPSVSVCHEIDGFSPSASLSHSSCSTSNVSSCTVEDCCTAPSCDYFDCGSAGLHPVNNPSCEPNCEHLQCCGPSRRMQIRQLIVPRSYFGENENGAWWVPFRTRNGLLVIGGDNLDSVSWFVELGFAVWVRMSPCYDPHCCSEALGYSTYLADTSLPLKPKMPVIGFIHGHTTSWYQSDYLNNLLEDARSCVFGTWRFASVSWPYQASIPHWIESNNFVGNWQNSRMEAVHPAPPVWNTFLGGQFMVTSELIESRSQYFYDQLLESVVAKEDSTNSKKCELDAYDLEFAWSWIFGEEANVDPMSKSLYPDGTCTNSPKRVRVQSESQLDWLSSFERSFHFDSDGIWSYPCDDISDTACANKVMLVIGSDPTIPSSQELLHDLLVVNKNRTASYGIWLRQPTLRCHYEEMGQTVNPSCKFTEGYSRFLHHYGVDDINGAENRFLNTDTFVFLSGSKPVTVTEIEEAVEGSRIRNGYFPLGEGVTDYCPSVQVGWPQPSGLRLPVRGFETDDFAVAAHNVYTIPKNVAGYVREHSTSLVVFKPEYFRAYWHYIFGSPAILTKETVDSQDQLFPLLTCDDTTGDVLLLGDESRGDVVGSYNGVLAIKVEDNNGGGVYGLSESTISSLGLVIVVVLVAVWMCRKKDDSSEPEPETKAKPEPEGPDASNSVV